MMVPPASAASSQRRILPPASSTVVPTASSRARVSSNSRETDAMDGSASPRNPRVAIESRSLTSESLLVAWRSKANSASSRIMPMPLSARRIRRRPPASTSRRNSVAPASSEFSSSSLTTLAGRSTTSPAAILLATLSERTRMRPIYWREGEGSLSLGRREDGIDGKAAAKEQRDFLASAVCDRTAVGRGDFHQVKGWIDDPEFLTAVFEAQLFLVEHLGGGVGRRKNFNHDLGGTEKIVFGGIPTTLRNESYIRNPILVFRDRPEPDFFFHNARLSRGAFEQSAKLPLHAAVFHFWEDQLD